MAIAATDKGGKIMRMNSVEGVESEKPWRFKKGNRVGSAGRPRGAKRLVRDAISGRLNIESFVATVNRDINAAERGDVRAALRVASVVRRLLFSDGSDMPRFWNTREARLKRQK